MISFQQILSRCEGVTLPGGHTLPGSITMPDAIIELDAEESMLDVDAHRSALKERFEILKQTVIDASAASASKNFRPKLIKNDLPLYEHANKKIKARAAGHCPVGSCGVRVRSQCCLRRPTPRWDESSRHRPPEAVEFCPGCSSRGGRGTAVMVTPRHRQRSSKKLSRA